MSRKIDIDVMLGKTRCLNASKHTASPEGCLQWHIWAERKMKTHKQIQCPTCGLFAIWKKK